MLTTMVMDLEQKSLTQKRLKKLNKYNVFNSTATAIITFKLVVG